MWWVIGIIGFIIIIVIAAKADGKHDEKTIAHRAKMIKKLRESIPKENKFAVSTHVDGFAGSFFFAVDKSNENIGFVSNNKKTIINFIDIIGVELIENGTVVSTKNTTRTIGGAIVGGVLAGGAGMIVGGLSGSSKQKNKVSSVYVKILLRSIDKPSLKICCYDSWMNSKMVKTLHEARQPDNYVCNIGKRNADKIKDLISVIIDKTDSKNKSEIQSNTSLPSKSIADELIKLNELKEKGILTENEFTVQKNKILNQ